MFDKLFFKIKLFKKEQKSKIASYTLLIIGSSCRCAKIYWSREYQFHTYPSAYILHTKDSDREHALVGAIWRMATTDDCKSMPGAHHSATIQTSSMGGGVETCWKSNGEICHWIPSPTVFNCHSVHFRCFISENELFLKKMSNLRLGKAVA